MDKRMGKLVKWNQDRGFGFVKDDVSGDTFFLHISHFVERPKREDPPPLIGTPYSFVVEDTPKGKQATQVSLNLTL